MSGHKSAAFKSRKHAEELKLVRQIREKDTHKKRGQISESVPFLTAAGRLAFEGQRFMIESAWSPDEGPTYAMIRSPTVGFPLRTVAVLVSTRISLPVKSLMAYPSPSIRTISPWITPGLPRMYMLLTYAPCATIGFVSAMTLSPAVMFPSSLVLRSTLRRTSLPDRSLIT